MSATIAPATEETFESLAQKVDEALSVVNTIDGHVKSKAIDLKNAVEAFHKFAITKIVQRLKADPRGKELLFELVDEPSVYAMLQLHGIVKPSLPTRINHVLDAVRPYMQSHGGDVEFVRVEGATAFVRMHGACNGCSQSAVTLRDGVEEAIKHNLPEIQAVEVLPNEPSPNLIQIESLSSAKNTGWIKGPAVGEIPAGKKMRFDTEDTSILIINVNNRLNAYRNACPHQGMPLDGGMLDAEACELTCPWHGFKFDAATGECFSAPQAQLESFPLRVEDGYIWVRPN